MKEEKLKYVLKRDLNAKNKYYQITYPETYSTRWFILMSKNLCVDIWYFIYNVCSKKGAN